LEDWRLEESEEIRLVEQLMAASISGTTELSIPGPWGGSHSLSKKSNKDDKNVNVNVNVSSDDVTHEIGDDMDDEVEVRVTHTSENTF